MAQGELPPSARTSLMRSIARGMESGSGRVSLLNGRHALLGQDRAALVRTGGPKTRVPAPQTGATMGR
ncbi:hypothetical protein [Streptomyces sp. TLI_171]|uniref:hypothetical protein n=1 Tax=Streptomyces sp. TLI_171 TaxID=1938859 RepID=UPI00217DABD8|nr:hypothetical protein [Streptomyces sp. TLI_171]